MKIPLDILHFSLVNGNPFAALYGRVLFPIAQRRHMHHIQKGTVEAACIGKPAFQGDVRNGTVGVAQQMLRLSHPAHVAEAIESHPCIAFENVGQIIITVAQLRRYAAKRQRLLVMRRDIVEGIIQRPVRGGNPRRAEWGTEP